jgi:hypothetical protein
MKALKIPKNAQAVVIETHEDGSPECTHYFLKDQKIAAIYWFANGEVEHEFYFRNGQQHGPLRWWYENGQLAWETYYVKGKEHGTSKQWNRKGNLLGTYEMNHGTGVDHWWDEKGRLLEEFHCLDGNRHGRERRFYNRRNQLSEEVYWKAGKLHGISREWNGQGRLRRGFPQYYVNGEKVNRRQYLKACQNDSTLIGFAERDNLPKRK